MQLGLDQVKPDPYNKKKSFKNIFNDEIYNKKKVILFLKIQIFIMIMMTLNVSPQNNDSIENHVL